MSDNLATYVNAVLTAREDAEARVREGDVEVREFSYPDVLVRDPLVSVEVVTYRHQSYLRKCVLSILHQKTTFPFEVIIGVDVSPDNTLEIAKSLLEEFPSQIRILVPAKNVGLNRNSKYIRRVMRGKYAALMEGDDWWLEGKLQRQICYMQMHVNCHLLFSPSVFYDDTTNQAMVQMARYIPSKKANWPFLMMTYRALPETSGVVCLVEDLQKIYQDYPHRLSPRWLCQDVPLFASLASMGEVKFLNEPLAVRRFTDQSLSSGASALSAAVFLDSVLGFLLMSARDFCLSKWQTRIILLRHFANISTQLRSAGFSRVDIAKYLHILHSEHKFLVSYWCLVGLWLQEHDFKNRWIRNFLWGVVCPITVGRRMFVTNKHEEERLLMWIKER